LIGLDPHDQRIAGFGLLAGDPGIGYRLCLGGLDWHFKRALVDRDEMVLRLLEQPERPRALAVGQAPVDRATPHR
jgi:hypothetical protein